MTTLGGRVECSRNRPVRGSSDGRRPVECDRTVHRGTVRRETLQVAQIRLPSEPQRLSRTCRPQSEPFPGTTRSGYGSARALRRSRRLAAPSEGPDTSASGLMSKYWSSVA